MTHRSPDSKDPDRPTKAVGSISWSDLGPLAGNPRVFLSLPFTVGALIVAVGWLRQINAAMSTPGAPAGAVVEVFLTGLVAVVSVLMPVALLWRVPSAVRSRTRLFLGLAVLAVVQVVTVVGGFLQIDPGASSPFTIDSTIQFIPPIGAALVAFGLLDLRLHWPGRSSLLIVLVIMYVGLEVSTAAIAAIVNAIGPTTIVGAGISWWGVLGAVIGAFTSWIVLDAWLNHEAPTEFWTLLSAAFLLALAGRIVGVPEAIFVLVFQSVVPEVVGFVVSIVGAIAAVLTFAAFVRYAPRPPEPARTEDPGAGPWG